MRKDLIPTPTILETFQQGLVQNSPKIVLAIFILAIGIILIRFCQSFLRKVVHSKSSDVLAADFIVNLISVLAFAIIFSVVLSILGWTGWTNKILTAAGIGTFVVGFALKDIGENFLAGFIMAFRRPFRLGDLVQVSGIKGTVHQMSLRETTLKSLDGRDIYIPNAMILKNPLENFTHDAFMRVEFPLELAMENDVKSAIEDILQCINSLPEVERKGETLVVLDDFIQNKYRIISKFWFTTSSVHVPGTDLRTFVMLRVLEMLQQKKYTLAVTLESALESKIPNVSIHTQTTEE